MNQDRLNVKIILKKSSPMLRKDQENENY